MKIKPFQRHGNFTTFDNALVDQVMPKLRPTSWVILCYILRMTVGWQGYTTSLSYGMIRDNTGIRSDTTVAQGVKQLKRFGLIEVVGERGEWEASVYKINRNFSIEVSTPKNGVVSTPENGESLKKEKEIKFPTEEYEEVRTAWYLLFPPPVTDKSGKVIKEGKPQPRSSTASYRTSFARRWKEKAFRENWKQAMERAAESKYLHDAGWFCFSWFIKNDLNWQKCFDGNYDDRKNTYHNNGEADKAWDTLSSFMSRWGRRKEPKLTPVTAEAIRLAGGYKELCTMDEQYAERTFKRAYKEASTRYTST